MGRLSKEERKGKEEEKSKKEWYYLNQFLDILPIPIKDIKKCVFPDFIAQVNEQKIGIEITEFHTGPSEKTNILRSEVEAAWDKLQKQIMEEVKSYTELNHTVGILFFREVKLPTSREYKSFVSELIQLSLSMRRLGYREKEPPKAYPYLNTYLESFHLNEVNSNINWEWSHSVGTVGLIENELQNIVENKLKKEKKYAEKDYEPWLLIISGSKLSQAMGLLTTEQLNSFTVLNKRIQDSQVKRVFIYQIMHDRVFEWPEWKQVNKVL